MSICNDCLHNGCCCDFYGANCNGFEDKSKYVKVVRCKDCKHFDENNACYCHAADDNGTPIFVREHDFCSYGERRETNE